MDGLPRNQRLVAQLLAMRGRMHGWEIWESLQELIPHGSIYGTLSRMQKVGLLEAEWVNPEQPGTPARKYFELTSKGVDALAREDERDKLEAKLLRRLRPARGTDPS